ncbi:vegetative incompatibility protein het-e-1 [Lasius niger]|uniref:Vegetative incompatibility protein het-e-1 n=1 Tax=Lasius niger TaxID=67767 RepID=A0A0J7K4A4_LASNI|nr:vegetative incompatibility protein het-e-1 [Lasius niger]
MMALKKGKVLPAQGDRTPRARRDRDIVPAPIPSSSDDGPSAGLGASPAAELAIAASREALLRIWEDYRGWTNCHRDTSLHEFFMWASEVLHEG